MSTTGLVFDRSENSADEVCLAVAGEVDYSNVSQLHEHIARIIAEPGVRTVIVDCGPLQFIDSLGVQTLLGVRRIATDNGVRFALTNMHGKVWRVMETLGVATLLGDAE